MKQFALLMLYGQDRVGIVAQVTKVLFETGCNIEDSSMTQLRNEFTVMLIVRLGEGVTVEYLSAQLAPIATALELGLHLQPLDAERAAPRAKPDALRVCLITVMGADRTGIVYQVARILEEENVSITDLTTRVIGSATRPVYTMVIEAQSDRGDLCPLADRLKIVGKELGVEILVRPGETYSF